MASTRRQIIALIVAHLIVLFLVQHSAWHAGYTRGYQCGSYYTLRGVLMVLEAHAAALNPTTVLQEDNTEMERRCQK